MTEITTLSGQMLNKNLQTTNMTETSAAILQPPMPSSGVHPAFRPEEMLAPTPAILEELARKSEELESATPEEILRWATTRFGAHFTMATAFGPEGMCILHMLAEIAPSTYVFNLDTGYQFKETLELRERVVERYGMHIDMRQPSTSVAEYEQLHGGPIYQSNPNQCCADRKIRVLEQTVSGFHAWASAIRRDQSSDRSVVPIVGWDKKFGLVKVSPLANWTKKDVWKKITQDSIPYNPLHDQGYPSIGCWPCTRAVLFGEDDRAGRWSGTAKTECGLHSLDEPKPTPISGSL